MQPINGIPGILIPSTPATTKSSTVGEAFSTMLKDMVQNVDTQQQAADRSIEQVHSGEARHLHEAMVAMEKADISIRYMVQVRNKALEAYQEIMRMQV